MNYALEGLLSLRATLVEQMMEAEKEAEHCAEVVVRRREAVGDCASKIADLSAAIDAMAPQAERPKPAEASAAVRVPSKPKRKKNGRRSHSR